MEISSILTYISTIVAVFSIPVSLQIFHQHKRKKFKDELENFTEYFEKFYGKDKSAYPLLLRDKAAQNLTRTPQISAEIVDFIINLHEKRLANFDTLIDHYHWGNQYLKVEKNNDEIVFSNECYASNLIIVSLYIIYFLMAGFAGFLFLDILNLSKVAWFDPLIIIASLIISLGALNTADNMKGTLKFLWNIQKANFQTELQENNERETYIDVTSQT